MALVNIGTSPNDGTGDKLRDAFDKINTGKEDAFSKNSAFNKSFGTVAGTVAEGNHNHSKYLALDTRDTEMNYNGSDVNTILNASVIYAAGVNKPAGNCSLLSMVRTQKDYGAQLSIEAVSNSPKVYVRALLNGVWAQWHKIYTSGDDGSGSGLNADLLDGYHASIISTANTVAVRDANQDITANAFITSSDRRLKENISALDKGIEGLKPVAFNFIEGDKSTQYGFIAQDMLKTHPELVKGTGKKREDGTIDYFSIKQIDIIALLVKDAQDKDKEIDDLKNRIEKLEKIISKLI